MFIQIFYPDVLFKPQRLQMTANIRRLKALMPVNPLRLESQLFPAMPHPPSSVPEYMCERSADVEPFSLTTVKFSENAAALCFKSRRKVLEETKTQTARRCGQSFVV